MTIGSLLGRWHQWRRGYTPERKLQRVALLSNPTSDDEDTLEHLMMVHIEQEIERLPLKMQLALQHVARAECLGVEVMFNPRLPTGPELDSLCAQACAELERRLLHLGLL